MKYENFMQQQLFEPLGMKDTTFWPAAEQVERIAKSYRPDATKTNLEAFNISQLIYPLSDRTRRFPMLAADCFPRPPTQCCFARCYSAAVSSMASDT